MCRFRETYVPRCTSVHCTENQSFGYGTSRIQSLAIGDRKITLAGQIVCIRVRYCLMSPIRRDNGGLNDQDYEFLTIHQGSKDNLLSTGAHLSSERCIGYLLLLPCSYPQLY
jgi:hypothetical protein